MFLSVSWKLLLLFSSLAVWWFSDFIFPLPYSLLCDLPISHSLMLVGVFCIKYFCPSCVFSASSAVFCRCFLGLSEIFFFRFSSALPLLVRYFILFQHKIHLCRPPSVVTTVLDAPGFGRSETGSRRLSRRAQLSVPEPASARLGYCDCGNIDYRVVENCQQKAA